jgi:hypothetical protein
VSILYLGGLVGALAAAKITDRFGARRTVLFFSYWTLIALCLNMIAFRYYLFEVVSHILMVKNISIIYNF